jgi:hypothetical protein
MAGFGAPVRTATPTETVASGVSLPAITWPEASTGSSGSCTTGTSNGSPRMTCALVPPPGRLDLVPGAPFEIGDHLVDRGPDTAGCDERDLAGANARATSTAAAATAAGSRCFMVLAAPAVGGVRTAERGRRQSSIAHRPVTRTRALIADRPVWTIPGGRGDEGVSQTSGNGARARFAGLAPASPAHRGQDAS